MSLVDTVLLIDCYFTVLIYYVIPVWKKQLMEVIIFELLIKKTSLIFNYY